MRYSLCFLRSRLDGGRRDRLGRKFGGFSFRLFFDGVSVSGEIVLSVLVFPLEDATVLGLEHVYKWGGNLMTYEDTQNIQQQQTKTTNKDLGIKDRVWRTKKHVLYELFPYIQVWVFS